jgi:signal transduction histidine kinase/CheY-like chemotaxis protein
MRAEQVAGVYRNALPGTLGSLIAGTILSGMLVHMGAVPLPAAVAFIALLVAHSSGRLVLVRAYGKSKPPPTDWRRWAVAASVSALAGGLSWGFGSLLLMDQSHVELQLMVLLVCAAIASGAIIAFGTYLPAYYCNLFSIMVPTTIWAAAQGDALHWTYAVLTSIWICVIAVLARTFARMLAGSLRLQFENLALATDLRRQKELAEEANVAKSRFLAAASHDLRQPVHALGMFVGALRDRDMDDDGRRLVSQIDGSVSALDSLFTSLLDISRLDAGVIQIHLRAFPIQPLLERICRDEAPAREHREIELRLLPCTMNVHSDPILLERILRNLVSNAIRYTDHGRVIVGCRRGRRLSIEVWDSGRGISPDQQDLIFQEFYQIGNPERDRTRGLGLGLAIVRRLTAMLDLELTLCSQPNRGSVFRLSVALAPPDQPIPAQPIDIPSGTLNPRFILVVDDEGPIRDAMRTLLTTWGHSVVAAGSGREMLERIADCATRPDLIISDYRLRDDENGIDVIQRLRLEFNDDIPGILMTGDTAPDRIRDASASSCFLMHKPVSNSKLRAAITNLTIAGAPLAMAGSAPSRDDDLSRAYPGQV